jgi:hypothetical protein
VPDLFVDDDLTFTSDSAVITFGADGDTTLTHTDGSGLTLNSTNKIMFNDASQFIQGSSATVLALGATDEIDLTATAMDFNGTVTISGDTTLEDGADLITASAGTSNFRAGVNAGNSITSGGNLTWLWAMKRGLLLLRVTTIHSLVRRSRLRMHTVVIPQLATKLSKLLTQELLDTMLVLVSQQVLL